MEYWGLILYVAFFVFIIGLCFGSFLNVVILRAFSNESISFPASKCPKCQTPLKWWHNIPVASYVFLRGKCAFCKEKISIQYPIVELFTGIMFLLVVAKFGFEVKTLFMLSFVSLFIVLAITDIKEKVIFDFHAYILIVLGLVYNFFNFSNSANGSIWIFNSSFVSAILGVVLGVVVMELLARFGYVLAGQRAFGEGDSFIAAALGAIFGWKTLLLVLLYSIVVQVVCTLPLFLRKLYVQKDYATLLALLGFGGYVVFYKFAANLGWLSNLWVFTAGVAILLALGVYACKKILAGMKNPDGMTYLPFGPAMVVAAGFAMFFIA